MTTASSALRRVTFTRLRCRPHDLAGDMEPGDTKPLSRPVEKPDALCDAQDIRVERKRRVVRDRALLEIPLALSYFVAMGELGKLDGLGGLACLVSD